MRKEEKDSRVPSIERILDFLKTGIWRMRRADTQALPWFGIKVLRIVLLTLRGFVQNRCQLRASSLTFYSLLSIVPVVAMLFGVAKGFGFQKTLEKEIVQALSSQGEVAAQVITYANRLLVNTRGGLVAGIGFAFLIWTVVNVFANIEHSFNEIWGVQEARGWGRKVSDYLSLMILLPLLFVISSTATVVVAGQIRVITDQIALLGYLAPLIHLLLQLLPLVVIWFIFTMLYVIMPNTQVRLRAALVAGIAAGTAYQIFQMLYVTFQVGVARNNAIYGSLAALPLFLIWLQASWMIVLSGAELSFATQNVDTYEFEPDANLASPYFCRLLSLRIVNLLIRHFSRGEKPLDESMISHQLGIPVRLLRRLLHNLVEAGVITPVRLLKEKVFAYQPAFDPDQMSIASVLECLENRGIEDIPIIRSPELEQIRQSMEAFGREIQRSEFNRPLGEIGEDEPR